MDMFGDVGSQIGCPIVDNGEDEAVGMDACDRLKLGAKVGFYGQRKA
jgi:hypothetical protein